MFVTPIAEGPMPIRWEDAKWAGGAAVRDLASDPIANARFVAPPETALAPKSYAKWSTLFSTWLARTQGIARLKSKDHKLLSNPNEDERAFRARLALLARESRDEEIAEVRDTYGEKLEALQARIQRKQDSAARHSDQGNYGFAAAALDALTSRSAGSALRKVGRAGAKAKSASRDKEDVATLTTKYSALQQEAQAKLSAIGSAHDVGSMGETRSGPCPCPCPISSPSTCCAVNRVDRNRDAP